MSLERAAIASLRAGDIGGLAALVERYQVQAVRTAYLIVRDRALAEDITQSAFIRAYERIGQFNLEAPFGPWFLRSVANDAIKAVERARRTLSFDTTSDTDGVTFTASPKTPLDLEVYLDGAPAQEFVYWVGDGQVNSGTPSNPVDFVPR